MSALIVCSMLWFVVVSADPEVGDVLPIQVNRGMPTVLQLPSNDAGGNYLLVAGSLASDGPSWTVRLTCRPVAPDTPSRRIPVEVNDPPEWWTWRVANDRSTMQRARKREDGNAASYSTLRLATERTFHLFMGDNNLLDADEYEAVVAKLVRVGEHCLIYVDADDKVDDSLLDEVETTFDEIVYPEDRATFGRHRDVNRDGKFTILLTERLDRLSAGKVSLSGFVRGADFYRDVETPFSNQCDMMYLNAKIERGAHLRNVLAHEYTHAITFSEHTFGEYLPSGQGRDEEAWLSEALAHLAENLHGDGWSNLDYRVSTYLSQPGSYRLVVPDYFHAGLWRCHGCRGATYLFLRHCVDRYGVGVLEELSRSNLNGIDNLEAATQTRFASLFREWSVTTAVRGITGDVEQSTDFSVDVFGELGSRTLAGVRPIEVNDDWQELTLAPTAWAPLLIHLGPNERREIEVDAADESGLQLTLVRLPNDLAEATLLLTDASFGDRHVRLTLSSDRPVRWETVAWERLQLRQENPAADEKASYVRSAHQLEIDSEQPDVTSKAIDLSEFGDDPVVVKCVGIDERGRRVAAWAVDRR